MLEVLDREHRVAIALNATLAEMLEALVAVDDGDTINIHGWSFVQSFRSVLVRRLWRFGLVKPGLRKTVPLVMAFGHRHLFWRIVWLNAIDDNDKNGPLVNINSPDVKVSFDSCKFIGGDYSMRYVK